MPNLSSALEEIAKAASSQDATKAQAAIQAARAALKEDNKISKSEILNKLDSELQVWQSKLSVIFGESVGRQGMVKHARHWIEQLKT